MKIQPIGKTKKYWKQFDFTKNKKYSIWVDSEDKDCKLFLNDKYQAVGIVDCLHSKSKYWKIHK
jgi:hypothetical protein